MKRADLVIDRSRASPNHGERAARYQGPDSLVLHYTGMRDGPSAIDWLCDHTSQVSCHYVVTEEGRVLQLVADHRRAWHAGRSSWHGETDMNSASIGIEIVNGGHDFGLPSFPEPQICAVIALCGALTERHTIPPDRVLAHSDIAPSRKRDPGERFPWAWLAREGVGLWPELPAFNGGSWDSEGPVCPRDLQTKLVRLGFGLPITGIEDADTTTVLRAFQRRYRPDKIDGIADGDTLRRLDAVLHFHGRMD